MSRTVTRARAALTRVLTVKEGYESPTSGLTGPFYGTAYTCGLPETAHNAHIAAGWTCEQAAASSRSW